MFVALSFDGVFFFGVTMVVYEMVYSSGPEDYKSDFYKNNSKESRKDFFDQMLEDAKRELSSIKQSDYVNAESYNWLTSDFKEKVEALNQMKDEFIKTGQSRFDTYISIGVAERLVKDV